MTFFFLLRLRCRLATLSPPAAVFFPSLYTARDVFKVRSPAARFFRESRTLLSPARPDHHCAYEILLFAHRAAVRAECRNHSTTCRDVFPALKKVFFFFLHVCRRGLRFTRLSRPATGRERFPRRRENDVIVNRTTRLQTKRPVNNSKSYDESTHNKNPLVYFYNFFVTVFFSFFFLSDKCIRNVLLNSISINVYCNVIFNSNIV